MTHFSGPGVHDRTRNGWGAIVMIITYPKGQGRSVPRFVTWGMLSALAGFGCMTLLGLL